MYANASVAARPVTQCTMPSACVICVCAWPPPAIAGSEYVLGAGPVTGNAKTSL